MPTARHWNGVRLLLTWLGVSVGFVVLRWLLGLGVYLSIFENERAVRVSGAWSSGFASGASLLAAAIAVTTLTWATATWFAGRKTRASMRAAEATVHRQVLM